MSEPEVTVEEQGAPYPASDFTPSLDHPDPTSYPRLCPDIPASGGVIRTFWEDFDVEEIPLYLPSGEGEHCYLTIVKSNRTTLQVRDHLARSLGIRPDDIGFAGFKDKRAIARQTFSIPGVDDRDLLPLETPWMKVVGVDRHTNKLGTGHLAGNRFKIKIREVSRDALEPARAVVSRLKECGLPNFYGPQRFGIHSTGARIGAALLRRQVRDAVELLLAPLPGIEEPYREVFASGDCVGALEILPPGRTAEAALLHALRKNPGNYRVAARRIPRQLRKMYYSAYQSELFNWCLKERMLWGDDSFWQPRVGDLAQLHPRKVCFEVQEGESSLSEAFTRAKAGEISPTGPMFGRKTRLATGKQGSLERAVLAAEGLRPQSWVSHVKGLSLDGNRRSLRVPIGNCTVDWLEEEECLFLSFDLPSGAFATLLLEQVMGPGRIDAHHGRPRESGPSS